MTLKTTGSNSPDTTPNIIRLTKDGVAPLGTMAAASGTWSSGTVVYGDGTSLWGTTLTAAEVNSPDFGVVIQLESDSNGGDRFRLYTAEIQVDYQLTIDPASVASNLDFAVSIADDGATEGDESWQISLSNPQRTTSPGAAVVDSGSVSSTIKDDDATAGSIVFSVIGDAAVTESPADADNNQATYTLGYSGTLGAGETAQVDVTHVLHQTDNADYVTDMVAAMTAAAATTPDVSFNGSTLTFAGPDRDCWQSTQ